jgi:hypothetical protein
MSQAEIDFWIGLGTISVTLFTLVWLIDPETWSRP